MTDGHSNADLPPPPTVESASETATFSPGPWQVVEYRGEWHIANRTCVIACRKLKPTAADARLIATAPDLLEAARRVLAAKAETDAWMALGFPARTLLAEPNRQTAGVAFAALEAAIAKATGAAQ